MNTHSNNSFILSLITPLIQHSLTTQSLRNTTALCYQDGWFKTGDIAVWETGGPTDTKQGLAQGQPAGSFRLLGRNSIDIIKSSGYKLSALEIEREILAHPQVLTLTLIHSKNKIPRIYFVLS